MLVVAYVTRGVPGPTVRTVVTDAVAVFPAALYTDSRGKGLIGAFITCEDNTVRYAFAVNPTQGANQVGHALVAGDSLSMDGSALIQNFRFINDVQQDAGVLQITPVYEI